jgi:hypothetical protein
MFDLPPGTERTVQYADFLAPFDGAQGKPFDGAQGKPFDGAQGGPRVSFVLVTIPSEVARGVVARSVAALSKGPFDAAAGRPNRLLGYVENMSGYYCRECNAIKPLFASPENSGLGIPCLGTVPFDPELARRCDRGISLADLPETPVSRALDHVAQQLLETLT